MTLQTRILTLALALIAFVACASRSVQARGPVKPDFKVNTHEDACGWFGDITGTWSMQGVDSGVVTGFVGFPDHWLTLHGEFGTVGIRAHIDPDTYEKTFEVTDGTGLYESWVGAVGAWDFRGGGNRKGDCWNSSRTLEGFLP